MLVAGFVVDNTPRILLSAAHWDMMRDDSRWESFDIGWLHLLLAWNNKDAVNKSCLRHFMFSELSRVGL